MGIFHSTKREFAKIYDEHVDKIYRFIFFKVSSVEIAQDLTSETFLRGWEAYKTTQGQNTEKENPENEKQGKIQNPKAFLYQIARNLVIDHYREKSRVSFVSTEEVIIEDGKNNPEKTVFRDLELEEMQKALQKLEDDYQDAIIWYYLDGLKIEEIAEILDKSENAVRLMVHRGLKTLKENLT